MAGAENLGHRNDFDDAITWLGDVGVWENRGYSPDTEFNQSVDMTLRKLADGIAEGDDVTASLLADLERQAELSSSLHPDIYSDYGEQVFRRRDQLYALTRLTVTQLEAPAGVE